VIRIKTHFAADDLASPKLCFLAPQHEEAAKGCRRALAGRYQPLFGNALWQEYCDFLGRDVWSDSTTSQDRQQVLAALAHRGRWVTIYYGWRPNLPDEADNHLVELALAGGAAAIVTRNVLDLAKGELAFKQLRVLTPAQCLEEWQ